MAASRLLPLLACATALSVLASCHGDEAGYRIAFQSTRSPPSDIYLIHEGGSDLQRLTDAPGADYEPDVSPDGSTIVFVSNRAGEGTAQLFLMATDGSAVRRLTFSGRDDPAVVDDYPHWSPDGRRIVFQRTRSVAGRADADIWLIDIETGEESQLTDTPNAWDSTPSFTADGRGVLFESNRDGDYEIYRLDLASRALTQLTHDDGADLEAKASPDGKRIVFASDRDGDFEVYTMALDGSDLRQLTRNHAADRCAHWSPDSKRLSFYSERDDNREIYAMNADGSDQRRLTNHPAADEVPAWITSTE